MAYKKSSEELKKRPSKKKVKYTKRPAENTRSFQSQKQPQSNNEIYSHSSEKSFDLSSVSNKAKKQKTRKKLIITNVILSVLLVFSTVSFAATAMLESRFFKNADTDLNEEKGKFEDVIVSPNANVSYFLICGVDLSENLTDVIMVACYDLANNNVNVLQIPRDTYVGNATSTGKINAVFGSARQGESKIKALMRNINENFALPIDHYATVTIKGTEDIIDAMGGIDITLTRDFHLVDDSRKPEVKKTFYKGKVHLSGQWATALIRHRRSFGAGDLGRVENQRKVYAAILKKLINVSFSELTSIATNCMDDITTDLSLGQILGYAQKAHELSLNKVKIMATPGYSDTIHSQSCWLTKKQECVDILNKYFMPYEKNLLTVNDLAIYGGEKSDNSYDSITKGGDLDDFDNDKTTATTSKKQ